MDVTVLGSGGFMPFPGAHLPGFLVRERGGSYLLDAGEGTQTRMVETGRSHARLDGVLISHMHADHVLGLPGVLIRRAREGSRDKDLFLGGPAALEAFLDCLREPVNLELSFPLVLRSLEAGDSFDLRTVSVHVAALNHRVKTFGFAVRGLRHKRKFHPDKARALDVPEGPLWGQLQRGQSVTLEDGRKIEPAEVSDPPPPGPSVVYLPDTRPVFDFPESFHNPDLLIHEAMFMDRHRQHAEEKGHSTAREAARVARHLGAGRLLLTHFSRRYSDPDCLVEEARETFPETERAREGMEIEID